MKEFELIKKLKSCLSVESQATGLDDDCAVIPQADGSKLLITTDSMVENVHFRRSYFSGRDLGWKLVSVNLSDIAAMGGVPENAVINLQIPRGFDSAYLEEVYQGMDLACREYGLSIVGGDTVNSEVFSLSLTVFGRTQNPIYRSAANLADDIWLSGPIGFAGLGLKILENEIKVSDPEVKKKAISEHLRPKPQVELGRILAEKRLANAMIDISDGFLQDLNHVAEQSGFSAELDLAKIKHASCRNWGLQQALGSGEDYQLLFTCSKESSIKLQVDIAKLYPSLHLIGQMVDFNPKLNLSMGYQHN